MQPVFETERLVIHLYEAGDFEDFFLLNGDEEVMRYIRPAQNREDSLLFFKKIIDAYNEQPGIGRWAMRLKSDGSFIGSFAIIPVQNSSDLQLGYSLLRSTRGKGYASEAVQGGIKYAFEQLKLASIAAITEIDNHASQKVLLRSGFVFEKEFLEGEKKLNLYRVSR